MSAPATGRAPAGEERRRMGLRWWREVAYVVAFFAAYSLVRNQFGDDPSAAFENATDVIAVERAMGLYFEEALQEWFLPHRWFIQLWNVFYGTFHFVVTAGALVWLFRRAPHRYPRWRNTLAATTGLALIGFALYPLMPPRLLPDAYGYVDTLAVYGGLWSFDSGAMKEVSNQYAAMPSLHVGWALWSAGVLLPCMRRWWARALVVLYPVATLFAIVVTANHYWLDAVGGAVVLAAGYAIGSAVALRTAAHGARRGDAEIEPEPTAPDPALHEA